MRATPLGLPRSAAERAAARRRAEERRARRLPIRPHQEPENSRIVPGSDEAMALPSEACLDAAVEILDACRDELARYDRALRGPGPRAQVSVYALMFGVLLVIAMRLDGIFITDVVKVLRDLPKPWRKRLGLVRPNNKKLSDRQVRHRLDRLLWVIGELQPSFADMPPEQRVAAFANRLIQLHLEAVGIAPQEVRHLAVDSSSIEAPAAVLVDESVIEGDKRYTKDPEAGPNFWPSKFNGTVTANCGLGSERRWAVSPPQGHQRKSSFSHLRLRCSAHQRLVAPTWGEFLPPKRRADGMRLLPCRRSPSSAGSTCSCSSTAISAGIAGSRPTRGRSVGDPAARRLSWAWAGHTDVFGRQFGPRLVKFAGGRLGPRVYAVRPWAPRTAHCGQGESP